VNPLASSTAVHFAPAKINVGLEVLERRNDGYHNIQSVFLAVNLCDELVFEPHEGEILLTCEPPVTAAVDKNIVYQAASLLKRDFGMRDWGAKITLRKNIPAGAGLGGGSSDAATTLRVLNEIWSAGLSPAQLAAVAAQVGSDVPFFIDPRPSLVTGRGELIAALTCAPEWDVLLVKPSIHVDTAWAYKAVNRVDKRDSSQLEANFVDFAHTDIAPPGAFCNDFEPVVAHRYPVLNDIRAKLQSLDPLFVSMSGSGSSMYALFKRGTAPTTFSDIFAPHFSALCNTL
jgi:4-diphosphocytidyl-2-C-methyl-D-erythritol kinase